MVWYGKDSYLAYITALFVSLDWTYDGLQGIIMLHIENPATMCAHGWYNFFGVETKKCVAIMGLWMVGAKIVLFTGAILCVQQKCTNGGFQAAFQLG